MAKHRQHTHEEKIEVSQKICDLYAANNFTLESCCKEYGITEWTFHNWKNEITEITEAYKKAKTRNSVNYKTQLREKAKTSMQKLIEGWEYKKTTKEKKKVGDIEHIRITETTEVVLPNPTMIIFAMTNTNNAEIDDFLHRNTTDHTTGGEPFKIVEIRNYAANNNSDESN